MARKFNILLSMPTPCKKEGNCPEEENVQGNISRTICPGGMSGSRGPD